jgi:hypothetical protein
VLTGIVVHEANWHEMLDRLVAFRKRVRAKFGLLLAQEIHAGKMLSRPGQALAYAIAKKMNFISIINIRVDKRGKGPDYDPFERGWEALIQRFENTLGYGNFPGPGTKDDLGIIFSDETDVPTLRKLYRRMRIYNPVPNMRSARRALPAPPTGVSNRHGASRDRRPRRSNSAPVRNRSRRAP